LPRLENDRAAMFSPVTVLRQHQWPAAPIHPHDDHAPPDSAEPDALRRKLRDRSSRFRNDMRLAVVEKDPQHVGSRHSADAAVAEIQTEQVGVRGMLVLVEGFEPPLYRF
jgi:hypothetical protein